MSPTPRRYSMDEVLKIKQENLDHSSMPPVTQPVIVELDKAINTEIRIFKQTFGQLITEVFEVPPDLAITLFHKAQIVKLRKAILRLPRDVQTTASTSKDPAAFLRGEELPPRRKYRLYQMMLLVNEKVAEVKAEQEEQEKADLEAYLRYRAQEADMQLVVGQDSNYDEDSMEEDSKNVKMENDEDVAAPAVREEPTRGRWPEHHKRRVEAASEIDELPTIKSEPDSDVE